LRRLASVHAVERGAVEPEHALAADPEVACAVEQDEHVFLHRFRSLDAAAERNVLSLCGN